MCELQSYNKYLIKNKKSYPFRNDEKGYLKEQALAEPLRMDSQGFGFLHPDLDPGQHWPIHKDLYLVKLAKNNTALQYTYADP